MEDGKRDTDIDRDMGESDGSSNFGRDFIDYCILLSFPPRLLNPCGILLFFLFPLQPRSMALAKFLDTNQQVADMRHQGRWENVPLA